MTDKCLHIAVSGSAGHNLYNAAPMAAEIAHYNSEMEFLSTAWKTASAAKKS